MARKDIKKEANVTEEQRVYCGPDLKGIANQNTVFIGELPPALSKVAGKCKAVEMLIVPPEKLLTTIAAVATPGTPESMFFQKATEYMKGVK